MAMVTGLEKRGKLIDVSLDERLFCSLDERSFRRCPLQMGQEVDELAYLDKVAAHQAKRAFEGALSLLDVCDRTERQVMEKLTRRGIVPQAAQAAVDRLKEMGLIDDAAYAQRLVQRQSDKAVGRYAMKRKLLQKGVDPEQAEAALCVLTGEQQQGACLTAAHQLARRYRGEENAVARRKLSQALARRGFSWDEIGPAMDEALGGDDEQYDD